MPTPIGHAIAGLAVACLAARRPSNSSLESPGHAQAGSGRSSAPARRPRAGAMVALCLVWATAADLDILVGAHRGASHSLGGAVLAGVAAAALGPAAGLPASLAAVSGGLSWGSHVLLDWLGKDSSPPHGIMLFWPARDTFHASGLDLFAEVSRRYWKPDEFIVGNLKSVAREVVLLGPLLAAAWFLARRPTLR